MGELVGEDQFGNKYYRNDEHFMGKWKNKLHLDEFGAGILPRFAGSDMPLPAA